jgi:hypothetical protein
MITLTHLQAHLQFAHADTQTKNCKRACKFATEKKLFFKIPYPSKFFKTATSQPTQVTAKATKNKAYSNSTDRTPAGNSTYPKGGISCSKDSFVVNQTLVFQIKFCGKSPALRVAAKR